MAASHKTKVVAKNISRIALMAEETTKFIAQGYDWSSVMLIYQLKCIFSPDLN